MEWRRQRRRSGADARAQLSSLVLSPSLLLLLLVLVLALTPGRAIGTALEEGCKPPAYGELVREEGAERERTRPPAFHF